jgi:hypothetical protein
MTPWLGVHSLIFQKFVHYVMKKMLYYSPPFLCTYEVDNIIRVIYTSLVVCVMGNVRSGHLVLVLYISTILLHHHLHKIQSVISGTVTQ